MEGLPAGGQRTQRSGLLSTLFPSNSVFFPYIPWFSSSSLFRYFTEDGAGSLLVCHNPLLSVEVNQQLNVSQDRIVIREPSTYSEPGG